MQKIYELEPREEIDVMGPEETKKCKVVPKKYSYIPDILPNNKRIEGETILELNKSEIARVMTLADVYLVGEDDSETLLNPENYYESLEEKSEAENEPSTGTAESVEPKSAPAPQQAQANTTNTNTQPQQQTAKTATAKMEPKTPVAQQSVEPKSAPAPQQAQANTTNTNTQPQQQTAKK